MKQRRPNLVWLVVAALCFLTLALDHGEILVWIFVVVWLAILVLGVTYKAAKWLTT